MMDVIKWLGVKTAQMYGNKAVLKPNKEKDREYSRRILYSGVHSNRRTPWEYGRKRSKGVSADSPGNTSQNNDGGTAASESISSD